MRLRFALLIFLLFSVGSVGAQPDDWQARFEQIIRDEMGYYHIPGAAVAVISGDTVIYAQGFGARSVEDDLPFTTETRFRVGSTTKSMTSMLIAQLVDAGALSWDTPVTEIFPNFATADPDLTARILVRDLFGMATGLVSSDLITFEWDTLTITDLLDVIRHYEIEGEFRNSHHYNNEVYALGGYAGVAASGLEPTLENYKALMQARIFDPIGMTSAIITDDHAQLGDNYAEPYEPDLLGAEGDVRRMIDPPLAFITPAGGVWVSIEDMAKYVITQMNGGITPDGTRIVSADNLAETWTSDVPMSYPLPGVEDARYGMGWITQTFEGIPMRWHNGGWMGYFTQMAIFPESDAAILVFSNSSLGGQFNDALIYSFAQLWHGKEVTAAAQARIAYAPITAQLNQIREIAQPEINAEIAAPLVGAYEGGWSIDYREEDSSLWLLNGMWSIRLVFVPLIGTYLGINNGGLGAQVDFNTRSDPPHFIIRGDEDRQYMFEQVE